MDEGTGIFLKVAAAGAIFLGIGLGLTWCVQGNDFFLYQAFAPKYEKVRRETFEQSKAYNQGMVQELQNMQFSYIQAKPEEKAALRSIILHRAADYDVNLLPLDLHDFIMKLRREQGQSE